MSVEALAPRELSPTAAEFRRGQNVVLWADLMDACDSFLLAGLRLKIGPDGDLQQAYRDSYKRHMEEHDRTIWNMIEGFHSRSCTNGGSASSPNT